MIRTIGIDPGKTGCLVALSKDGIEAILPFEKTDGLVKNMDLIIDACGWGYDMFLENVHAFTGQGAKSIFTFGNVTGRIEGIMISKKQAWTTVLPQAWQKELGLTGPYATKVLRKQAHVKMAKRLFPAWAKEITLDTADAILIAEYGYRKMKQEKEFKYGI